MPGGVLMHRRSGEVVASNPAARRMAALDHDQLTGQAPISEGWQLLAPDGRPLRTHDPATQTRLTGEPLQDQVVGVRSGDRLRWLSVSTTATRDDRGDVDYVISSVTDVTERHAAELASSQHRRDARARIEAVLDRSAVDVVFQPIIDLSRGRMVGCEALARFPDEPVRPPNAWFAEAADVGLGVDLELAAIEAALDRIDRLPRTCYLSVNISPTTVVQADVARVVERGGCERVVLEMTEHACVDDYPALDQALLDLRHRGVRVAVDDAGAGFSSLRHVLHLQPEVIKLDMTLTRGVHDDPARRALAASLLAFSEQMDAVLVAEGIETTAELHALKSLGINYGQGYLLGRPLPRPAPTPVAEWEGDLEPVAG